MRISRKTKRAASRLIVIVCVLLTACVVAGTALDTMIEVPDVTMLRGADGQTLIVRITSRKAPAYGLPKTAEYQDTFAARLDQMAEIFAFSRIQVEINARGGLVRAARGIAQALAARREYKHFVIDGLCGSSMIQILALGKPDFVSMTEQSSIILHQKRNAYTMTKTGNDQDEIAGIARLTGQDEETVKLWFLGSGNNEWTQFNRKQASALGFLGAKTWQEVQP